VALCARAEDARQASLERAIGMTVADLEKNLKTYIEKLSSKS